MFMRLEVFATKRANLAMSSVISENSTPMVYSSPVNANFPPRFTRSRPSLNASSLRKSLHKKSRLRTTPQVGIILHRVLYLPRAAFFPAILPKTTPSVSAFPPTLFDP